MDQNNFKDSTTYRQDVADYESDLKKLTTEVEYDVNKLTTELCYHKSKTDIFEKTIKAQQVDLDRIHNKEQSHQPKEGVYQ